MMRPCVHRAGLGIAAAVALMLAHPGGTPARAEEPAAAPSDCAAGAAAMTRVELFFGTARRDRAPVSKRQWRRFVATEVVPRFPDGFTELEARGHWRTDGGSPMSEQSHVLVIWLKPDPAVEERIEALRRIYRTRFAQESVLRAESRGCASF
jgi:hypothetical protein